jgi:hypothetical protein
MGITTNNVVLSFQLFSALFIVEQFQKLVVLQYEFISFNHPLSLGHLALDAF